MARKKFDEDEALALLDFGEAEEVEMDEFADEGMDEEFDTETSEDLASQLIAELKSEKPDPATVVSILEGLVGSLI